MAKPLEQRHSFTTLFGCLDPWDIPALMCARRTKASPKELQEIPKQMRPIGFGLIAALFVALMAPAAATAAPAPAAKPAGVSPESRKQGMADAPALVQAAGLNC